MGSEDKRVEEERNENRNGLVGGEGKVRQVGARSRSVVTGRDIEIAKWLGRHRLATAEQVMRRFEMHRAKTYARLGVLVQAGLVRFEPGVRSKRVYLATSAGLAATALRLPPGTVSPASFAHDIATVDVAIDLESISNDRSGMSCSASGRCAPARGGLTSTFANRPMGR
jgi:hypothetical protein